MIPIPRGGIFAEARGVASAERVPGVEAVIITAKQGQELLPLPEGASYLGFIFARANDPHAVEQALRMSHSELGFSFAATLPVVN